jgi:hypothetical protein
LSGLDYWLKFYEESDKYKRIGDLIVPEISDDEPLPDDTLCMTDEQKQEYEQKKRMEAVG